MLFRRLFKTIRKVFKSRPKSSRKVRPRRKAKKRQAYSRTRRLRPVRKTRKFLSRRKPESKKRKTPAASPVRKKRKIASSRQHSHRKAERKSPHPISKLHKKPLFQHKKEKSAYVGDITHYFSKIMVCVVNITHRSIKIGDNIHILGKTTNFKQKVQSLQVESRDVETAKKGQLVGLKVQKPARDNDKLYKIDY